MKKAIVYYSMTGNTDYVARCIAEKVNADLIRIEPKKGYPDKGFIKFLWGGKSAIMGETPALLDYEFDESKYDLVIFGTPVWASIFAPPIRSFIKENRDKLANKKFAAFACYSGSGADKTLEKLKEYVGIDKLEAELCLIDPNDKKSDEKNKQIDEFCTELNKW